MNRAAVRQALEKASPWYWTAYRLRRRLRLALLTARVTVFAALRGSTVELAIDPDVVIGRRVLVEIEPGTSNRLTIGSASRLHDGVTIWLRGGNVDIGREVMLRRRVELNSSGNLRINDGVILSWGTIVHCSESILIDERAGISEYCTITDSAHLPPPPGEHLVHHISSKPTRVGRDTWLGAHALIAAGVDVGDRAFIGGSAVVTRDVAPGWLAAGNPAKAVRELEPGAGTDGADG